MLAEAFQGEIHADFGPVYGVDGGFPGGFMDLFPALSRVIREFIDGLFSADLIRRVIVKLYGAWFIVAPCIGDG